MHPLIYIALIFDCIYVRTGNTKSHNKCQWVYYPYYIDSSGNILSMLGLHPINVCVTKRYVPYNNHIDVLSYKFQCIDGIVWAYTYNNLQCGTGSTPPTTLKLDGANIPREFSCDGSICDYVHYRQYPSCDRNHWPGYYEIAYLTNDCVYGVFGFPNYNTCGDGTKSLYQIYATEFSNKQYMYNETENTRDCSKPVTGTWSFTVGCNEESDTYYEILHCDWPRYSWIRVVAIICGVFFGVSLICVICVCCGCWRRGTGIWKQEKIIVSGAYSKSSENRNENLNDSIAMPTMTSALLANDKHCTDNK